MTTWHFCPWCGHRLYQHNKEGCLHIDVVLRDCTDPNCTPNVILSPGAKHAHEQPDRCDCKHPHPMFLAGAST